MTHILIVDDREESLYLLKVLLEGNGYTTDTASNGEEALQIAKKRRPDVVISDLLMPVMDGYTLLRHWRADAGLREVPFIVYTATYTEPQDEELALKLGADAFIAKPSDPTEFLAHLKAIENTPHVVNSAFEEVQPKGGADLLELYSQTLVRKLEQRSTQLEQRDAEFRVLAEVVPQIIWIGLPDGRNAYLNPQWTAYTGLGREESSGDAWLEAIHPDDQQKVGQAWQHAIDSAGPYEVECRLRRSDGAYRWWLVRGAPFRDASGTVVKWFGACTDVHDIKEAEVRIRQQAALLDKARDAIFVCDLTQCVTYWNQGAERVYGWMSPEVLSRNLCEFLFKNPVDCEDALRLTRSNGEWVGEFVQLTKEGKALVIDARWSLVHDSDGNPQSILAINTDITEKKALQAQFLSAQRMESVGRLTGGIAHDFNNLLTVIVGSSELLVRQLKDDPQRLDLAEMIVSAAQRGAELTQRLLAFARKQPLDPRKVDVGKLLAEMEALLRRALGEHIEFERIQGPEMWDVLIDPGQLENAVLNLCINARDAMPRGGKLTIETVNVQLDSDYAKTHLEVEPGAYVMLAVTDSGTGIHENTIDRVFEPFFTTKNAGEGTGLGLPMVYGFVKQSGGHISINSERGEGTTVRLYLPRIEDPEEPENKRAIGMVDGQGGAETILLVEDDDLVRRFALDQLAHLGYTVIEARHGKAALGILAERDDIDLLFTDVVMPGGMTGRQLADAAVQLRPSLKVLYTSGYAENAIVHHGRLDPGVRLLAKPYRQADLARMLRDVLDS